MPSGLRATLAVPGSSRKANEAASLPALRSHTFTRFGSPVASREPPAPSAAGAATPIFNPSVVASPLAMSQRRTVWSQLAETSASPSKPTEWTKCECPFRVALCAGGAARAATAARVAKRVVMRGVSFRASTADSGFIRRRGGSPCNCYALHYRTLAPARFVAGR